MLRIISFFLLLRVAASTCDNYVSMQESTCQVIFEQLQNAIVENKANLYNLRKVFYPTSSTEPTLVNVSYNLNWTLSSSNSCPGDNATLNRRIDANRSNIPLSTCNLMTDIDNVQHIAGGVWTSKIFYTLYHPATINRMQPQLVQALLVLLDELYMHSSIPTALTWNTTGPILTVDLYLTFTLPCVPTIEAFCGSIYDITSLLKVYANSQEGVSEWNEEEKGYSLSGLVLSSDWWRWIVPLYPASSNIPLINTIISIALTIMITFGIYFAIWRVAPSKKDEKNFIFSHTFVWCGVVIFLQLNIIMFFTEIGHIGLWHEYRDSCNGELACAYKIIWLVWMAIYMIIAFIVLLIRRFQGKIADRDLLVPEWRAFIVANPIISNAMLFTVFTYQFTIRYLLKIKRVHNAGIHFKETLTYFIRCPKLLKILKKALKFLSIYFLYMTIFMSVSIFSYSIVPVLLQAFLYPFRVFAAYSFILTSWALFAFSTFLATFLWKERKPTTGKLILYLSSPSIAILFIAMINTPFVSLYQLLVSGSFSDSPLVLAAASILPSVILSSPLIWVFKQKLLPRFLEIDEDDDEEDEKEEEKKDGKKPKMKKSYKVEEEASGTSNETDVEMQKLESENLTIM